VFGVKPHTGQGAGQRLMTPGMTRAIAYLLLGEPKDRVHIHHLSMDSAYLANLQALEVKFNRPGPGSDFL
jgi:hypothetical protein